MLVGDAVLIGSYDGSLYGLAAADGAVRWRYHTDNYVHGTPSVVNGVAHFAGCDDCPVERISLGDVETFLHKLNESSRWPAGTATAT